MERRGGGREKPRSWGNARMRGKSIDYKMGMQVKAMENGNDKNLKHS